MTVIVKMWSDNEITYNYDFPNNNDIVNFYNDLVSNKIVQHFTVTY
jgi:hypothetical protein